MARTPSKFAIGELSCRVDVVAPIGVLDEAVAVTIDENVPVKIRVLPPAFQPSESESLGGLNTHTKYNLTTRYRTDIKLSYVFNEKCCTERQFQIVAIIPSDRRDALEMTCVTNG